MHVQALRSKERQTEISFNGSTPKGSRLVTSHTGHLVVSYCATRAPSSEIGLCQRGPQWACMAAVRASAVREGPPLSPCGGVAISGESPKSESPSRRGVVTCMPFRPTHSAHYNRQSK